MLLLRKLGTLELRGVDGPILVGRRKELSLLAYVARQAPKAVSRATLATLLWGDRDDQRARHMLCQALPRFVRMAPRRFD